MLALLNRDWSVLRRPLRVVLPQCANLKCAARERHLPANLGLSVDRRTGSRGQVRTESASGPRAPVTWVSRVLSRRPGLDVRAKVTRVGSGQARGSLRNLAPVRRAQRRTSPVALIVDWSGRRGRRLVPSSGLIEPLIHRVAAMADAEATTVTTEATTVTNAARRRRQWPTGPDTDATTTAARTDTEARREGTGSHSGRYMPASLRPGNPRAAAPGPRFPVPGRIGSLGRKRR